MGSNKSHAEARIAALNQVLAAGPARATAIQAALQDESGLVREHAVSLAARFFPAETLGRMVADQENAVLRNSAISALERQGPYAVPHLMQLSRSDDTELAMFAVQVLAKIRDPSTIEALLPMLDHLDHNISHSAAEALGNLKAREAVPALVRLLSADLWLQFAAAAALGEIGDPRAVPSLLEALSNDLLAEVSLEALGKIGSREALPAILAMLVDDDRLPLRDHCLQAAAAVVGSDTPAPEVFARLRLRPGASTLLDYLDSVLRSDDDALARSAASLAVAATLRELYPALLQRSKTPLEVRWIAGLFKRFHRESRLPLLELLDHPSPEVRRGVLTIYPFESADLPRVVLRLRDDDPRVRAAACGALGRKRVTAAIPYLIESMCAQHSEERAAAADALARMPANSLSLLEEHLDPDGSQVLTVLGILESARCRLFDDVIARLLEDRDATIRRAAVRVLGTAPRNAHLPAILGLLDDPDVCVRIEVVESLVRRRARETVPRLLPLLEVADPLRYHVVRGLGQLRAPSAAPALVDLYPAAAPHERLEVVAALVRIAPLGLMPFLKSCLDEEDTEVRRVAADGISQGATREDMNLLLVLASDPDWNVRNHAAWGLGRLGDPRARETLLMLVRDVEAVVARTARSALAKLVHA